MPHRLYAALEARLQSLNFCLGQRCGSPIEADKPCHAGNLQDLQGVAQSEAHEHVAGEKRQLDARAGSLPGTQRNLTDTLYVETISVCTITIRLSPSAAGVGFRAVVDRRRSTSASISAAMPTNGIGTCRRFVPSR